jgi:DNA-binding HxlR family transcriptional regulator
MLYQADDPLMLTPMSRTPLDHWQCSLARTADILGDKWTLMILRDAFFGLSTFSQFQQNLRVARNVLSDRLDKLVRHGILAREPVRPGVERYHYRLTEAGQELYPALVALMQWGDKWVFGAEGEPVVLVDREQGAPIQKVGLQARDGRYLRARDVAFVPGPNAPPALVAQYKQRRQPKTPAE